MMGILFSLFSLCALFFAANPSDASVREILKGQYKQMAMSAAVELALDPALLFAVISNESDWQARIRSPKGALGLMQLMPETARNWEVKDPLNPVENIYGGARYLKHLISLFDRNLPLALAAYHAGEERTLKARGALPDIPETRSYVHAVLESYVKLKSGSKNY